MRRHSVIEHFSRDGFVPQPTEQNQVGPSESSSSSSQSSSNQQTTVGNAAEGSTQFAVGSGTSYTGAGGISASNSTVNVTNADSGLVASIGDTLANVAGTAEVNNATTANNAIIGQTQTAGAALGFGSEVVAGENQLLANVANTNAQTLTATLGLGAESLTNAANVAAQSTANALQFGSEALSASAAANNAAINAVANVAAAGQETTSQQTAYENQTIQTIAGDLAQLTANATPQTAAAQSELLAGTSPTGASASGFNWTAVSAIAGIAAAIYLVTKK